MSWAAPLSTHPRKDSTCQDTCSPSPQSCWLPLVDSAIPIHIHMVMMLGPQIY